MASFQDQLSYPAESQAAEKTNELTAAPEAGKKGGGLGLMQRTGEQVKSMADKVKQSFGMAEEDDDDDDDDDEVAAAGGKTDGGAAAAGERTTTRKTSYC